MRFTRNGRVGVVAVAFGLAASGIAYAAIPDSRGAVQSPLSGKPTFLAGGSGGSVIGPHTAAAVGLAAAAVIEPVSMPVSGTLSHLHVAIDHSVTSNDVVVALNINGTSTVITCTISSGRRCSNMSQTAGFHEGDLIDTWVVNNTANDIHVTWAVRTS